MFSFFFCRFGQILFNLAHKFASWKQALFPRFLRTVLITYLITWSLEKEMIVLEKYSVEKVLNVVSKNLYETLSIVKMANNWFCWWQGKAFMSVSVQWQVISSTTGNKNCVSNIADSDILGFLFLTLHTLPSGIVPGFLCFRSIILGLNWFVSDISCVLTSDRLLTVDTMHALCSNTKLVKETMHKGKLLGTNTTWLRKCGLMLWGSYFPIFSFTRANMLLFFFILSPV